MFGIKWGKRKGFWAKIEVFCMCKRDGAEVKWPKGEEKSQKGKLRGSIAVAMGPNPQNVPYLQQNGAKLSVFGQKAEFSRCPHRVAADDVALAEGLPEGLEAPARHLQPPAVVAVGELVLPCKGKHKMG